MATNAPLLLIPTAPERKHLEHVAGRLPDGAALCGLGPVAAAARTAGLLASIRPPSVVLLGIAGTFDGDAFPMESAMSFGRTAMESGVPGLPAWPGDGATPAIDGPLDLADGVDGSLLLTVHRPSDGRDEVNARQERYPDAVGEDMEAWGVAFACAMANVPLQVARGASNVVGDRNRSNWRIVEALAAAWTLVKPQWDRDS